MEIGVKKMMAPVVVCSLVALPHIFNQTRRLNTTVSPQQLHSSISSSSRKKANQNEIAAYPVVQRKNGNATFPLPWSLPEVPAIMKTSQEFMKELDELKRKNDIPLPWNDFSSKTNDTIQSSDRNTPTVTTDRTFRLPTPVVILNLPKSGTQTLQQYFQCGKLRSAHTYVNNPNVNFRKVRIGDCLRENFLANDPPFRNVAPFDSCDRFVGINGNHSVITYSDIGVAFSKKKCFYSTLHDGGLDHLVEYYPNATLVLMVRNADSWYDSIRKWGKGRILRLWNVTCDFHGPFRTGTKEDWIGFYHAHTEKIRQFAKKHLGVTYVEVELNKDTPSAMEFYTGVSAKCFRHCYPERSINMCEPHAEEQ